jgi:hypothetical protein
LRRGDAFLRAALCEAGIIRGKGQTEIIGGERAIRR